MRLLGWWFSNTEHMLCCAWHTVSLHMLAIVTSLISLLIWTSYYNVMNTCEPSPFLFDSSVTQLPLVVFLSLGILLMWPSMCFPLRSSLRSCKWHHCLMLEKHVGVCRQMTVLGTFGFKELFLPQTQIQVQSTLGSLSVFLQDHKKIVLFKYEIFILTWTEHHSLFF